MDDQTIRCDPKLASAVIDAHQKRGGIRNRLKTHAIIYATPYRILQHQTTLNQTEIQQKAKLDTPTNKNKTLGATLGVKSTDSTTSPNASK